MLRSTGQLARMPDLLAVLCVIGCHNICVVCGPACFWVADIKVHVSAFALSLPWTTEEK